MTNGCINKSGSATGAALKSLVAGFAMTKRTEGKSPRSVEYYQDNLKAFSVVCSETGLVRWR